MPSVGMEGKEFFTIAALNFDSCRADRTSGEGKNT